MGHGSTGTQTSDLLRVRRHSLSVSAIRTRVTTNRSVTLPSPYSFQDRPITGQEGAMPETVVVDGELAALWLQGGKWPRSLRDVKVPAFYIPRSYAITNVFWKCVLACVHACLVFLNTLGQTDGDSGPPRGTRTAEPPYGDTISIHLFCS